MEIKTNTTDSIFIRTKLVLFKFNRMKFLIPLLLITSSLFAQAPCEDFFRLIGQRDINESVVAFQKNCGPFDEEISEDGSNKTWISKEKGITLTFVNREDDKFSLPKYELLTIELTSFTGKGGYKGEWPLGFMLGMDYKMVKDHIKSLNDVNYERGDIGKRRSYFTYTGPTNDAAKDRKIKVYVSQYDGTTITTLRLRLD